MDYTSKIAELQADVKTIWKLQCQNLYNSKNLGALAVRECLQNSIDALAVAIRKRQIEKDDAEIHISYDNDGKVVIQDNGCGMDVKTIHEKFLCLGGTTKGDEDSVGGFGLAKAVILGCGETFEIWTQDNYFSSKDLGKNPITKTNDYLQGTKMVLYRVQVDKDQILDGENYWRFKDAVQSYVSSSEIPYRVYLNDELVGSKFVKSSKTYRTPATFNISSDMIPDNTKLKINVYKTEQPVKLLYVRLRGLTQFTQYLGWNANCDVVLDFQTKLDPRDSGYPFATNREGLKAQYQGITEAIRDKINQSPLSVSTDDRFVEKYFENTNNSIDKERTIYKQFTQKETKELVNVVKQIVEDSQGIQPQGGYKPPTLVDRWQQYQQSLKDLSEMEGKTVSQYMSDLGTDKIKKINNPLEYSWLIWTDKYASKKIREATAVKFIMIWDGILKLMAEKSNMVDNKVYYPGIIIKDDTMGMCVERTLDTGEQRTYIMLNPFEVPNKTKSLEQIAIWLMGTASHELSHFVCGCFEAHGETFSYTREAIMNNCLEIIPQVVKLLKNSKFMNLLQKINYK